MCNDAAVHCETQAINVFKIIFLNKYSVHQTWRCAILRGGTVVPRTWATSRLPFRGKRSHLIISLGMTTGFQSF